MTLRDQDLTQFEAKGTTLPRTTTEGVIEHDGARIWYATFGEGPPVILLHGGLGHSGNWANQIAPLVDAGQRVIVIDTRGHGRSTRDERPYTYELLASDVRAVMDALDIDQAAFAGWSDGACVALILAAQSPERAVGVFFFACNMDPSGTKPFEFTPIVERCFNRHVKDYARLSATPGDFKAFSDAVARMQQTEPNYTADDLSKIQTPVAIVHAESDEFIKLEHASYLARNIPGAEFVLLPGVSHFAPLQRPTVFDEALLHFVQRLNR